MWEIEYGADYADSYEIRCKADDWDKAMTTLSNHLADMVDHRLIEQEEFEQGMEWVTGVVIDDHDVRVPGLFGGLTIALTLRD